MSDAGLVGIGKSLRSWWPNAELVQSLPSRQLLGVKRTCCAHRELFRVWPDADLVQRLPSRQLLGVKRTYYARREIFRVW
jgi:hypothetical protein